MNGISWNVRGLGSNPTFREAQKLLQMHRSKLVFLCETKLTPSQMQEKSQKLNFENCFQVDRIGKRGGLALMWDSNLRVDVKSWSRHHIDVVVCAENGSY